MFPQVPLISCTELRQLMDGSFQVIVVDTRTPEEIDVSIIPGVITQEQYEARKKELAGKTVVFYCTVGYRSSSYAAKLKASGVDAKNLEGGIVRWAQKRYPLVRPPSAGEAAGQATTRVHVYSKQFALQPEEYEPVVFKNPLFSWLRRALPPWAGGSNGKKPVKDIKKEGQKVKVVFTRKRKGQPDKEVVHNPSTLEKVTADNEDDSPDLQKAGGARRGSARGGRHGGGAATKAAAPSKGKGKKREEEEGGGEVAPAPAQHGKGKAAAGKAGAKGRDAAEPRTPKAAQRRGPRKQEEEEDETQGGAEPAAPRTSRRVAERKSRGGGGVQKARGGGGKTSGRGTGKTSGGSAAGGGAAAAAKGGQKRKAVEAPPTRISRRLAKKKRAKRG
ncbi:rhodanese-like domain [Micractinium conductrix]|uniref:Rhodanese-like domain n=1 Tax=Micractinium conductrix TaxID=554055 RepID=A0A2P6VSD0_9CHLO|nr:rhodanese-like domain [Micractinium conductrix]|eukprot:PSC76985.1 rhodanese-like domain [Micractinium conductrix]